MPLVNRAKEEAMARANALFAAPSSKRIEASLSVSSNDKAILDPPVETHVNVGSTANNFSPSDVGKELDKIYGNLLNHLDVPRLDKDVDQSTLPVFHDNLGLQRHVFAPLQRLESGSTLTEDEWDRQRTFSQTSRLTFDSNTLGYTTPRNLSRQDSISPFSPTIMEPSPSSPTPTNRGRHSSTRSIKSKRFSCPFAGCSASYARKDGLKNHYKKQHCTTPEEEAIGMAKIKYMQGEEVEKWEVKHARVHSAPAGKDLTLRQDSGDAMLGTPTISPFPISPFATLPFQSLLPQQVHPQVTSTPTPSPFDPFGPSELPCLTPFSLYAEPSDVSPIDFYMETPAKITEDDTIDALWKALMNKLQ